MVYLLFHAFEYKIINIRKNSAVVSDFQASVLTY